MIRAAIYARYSSNNQREESITAQLRACHTYCYQKKYTVIHEYTDEVKTGRNDDRPGYQAMLRDAQAGLFAVLVCHKLDRAGRDEYDYYFNKAKLQKAVIRQNAYQAKHNGGKPPLGYDVVNGKYVINEKEAQIVRRIFELRTAGAGYIEIISDLSAKGYLSKSGKPFG